MHTTKAAGLPNISGSTYSIVSQEPFDSGALTGNRVLPSNMGLHIDSSAKPKLRYIDFNASKSNALYGASNTVQPPSIVLIPQIKF